MPEGACDCHTHVFGDPARPCPETSRRNRRPDHALVVFLAISIALDGRGSSKRLDSVTNTTIPGAGGPDVRAYVAKPSTPGPHPVVVMIHEFWGLNPDIVSKAAGRSVSDVKLRCCGI